MALTQEDLLVAQELVEEINSDGIEAIIDIYTEGDDLVIIARDDKKIIEYHFNETAPDSTPERQRWSKVLSINGRPVQNEDDGEPMSPEGDVTAQPETMPMDA
jgi:hypothetical protein